jgi:hypothetical protein
MPAIENNYSQPGGKPVEIAYIGRKEIKQDTLCRTGVTWFGQFDIQTVEAVPASRLLKFPSVFIRADKLEEYMEALEDSLAEDDKEDDKEYETFDQESTTQDSPSLADAEKTSDPAEDEAREKAIEAIQAVIISLDQENPDHFTTRGKPKSEAVRTRMPDIEVSVEDIAEAFKSLEV